MEFISMGTDKQNAIGNTDPLTVAYNESIYFDRAFYSQDIAGSIAFARANIGTGILSQEEFQAIETGFQQVRKEWETDTFKIVPGVDEDIHTANERRLGEIIGTGIAGKLVFRASWLLWKLRY
jgi:argininosuccinate lyase